jgi:ankyrin repeat protein
VASAPKSVQLLLGAGASVNARNERGWTALMYSLRSTCVATAAATRVVEALLAAGACVNAADEDGNTALHHLASRSQHMPWAADAARLLLSSGEIDGRIQNHAGVTPAQAIPGAACGGVLHRLLLAAFWA